MSFTVVNSDGKHFPIDPTKILSKEKIEFISAFGKSDCLLDLDVKPRGVFVGGMIWKHEEECESGFVWTRNEKVANCTCFAECHGIIDILN